MRYYPEILGVLDRKPSLLARFLLCLERSFITIDLAVAVSVVTFPPPLFVCKMSIVSFSDSSENRTEASDLSLCITPSPTASKSYPELHPTLGNQGGEAILKEYSAVLSKLFKPVKLAPRHSNSVPTIDEVFASRKKVFNDLYTRGTIHHNCKIIHIAGTKGKGSSVEYISSSLIGNGHKVGIFTSPHMHTARERVKVNRQLISRQDIIRLGKDALQTLSAQPWVVFFDLLLVLALNYFNEQKVQYMVLESGIGGRYDSTNFADSPTACVITSISIDHQQMLGETIEEIAYQKAGIITPHTHVFTPATQSVNVLEVFRNECTRKQAVLHEVQIGREFLADQGVYCETDVQVENACLSRAVLAHLDVSPTGWDKFFWPCRMERFLYQGQTIVLDGCHNGHSMERFLAGLRDTYGDRKIVVLFGAGQEKCLSDMVERLFAGADAVMMVQSKHFRALPETELLRLVPQQSRHLLHAVHAVTDDVVVRRSLGERLQQAVEMNPDSKAVIAVCGSLFAAAEAREHLFSRAPALFDQADWVRQRDPDYDL